MGHSASGQKSSLLVRVVAGVTLALRVTSLRCRSLHLTRSATSTRGRWVWRVRAQGGLRPQPNVWLSISAPERGLGGEVWWRARHPQAPPPRPPSPKRRGGRESSRPRGNHPDINEAQRGRCPARRL